MRKRDIVMILAAIGVAIGVAVGIFITSTLETGSWGLSFRQEGAAPIGPAGADQLKKYDAAYLGDTSEKVIYLTFDAGYENGATERILDTLQKHNVKAAFFLVGNYIERNADLVRRMAEEGHTVGNHTMHHPDMSKLKDKEAFAKELLDLEELYREKTGQSLPKYYRPPQGIYSEENLKLAKDLGALPTWTGKMTASRAKRRPSPSSFPGSTPAPWRCSTPRRKPTRRFWTSC